MINILKGNSVKFITKENWQTIDKIELEECDKNFARNKLVDLNTIFKYLNN